MEAIVIEPQKDEDVVITVTNNSGKTIKVMIPQDVFDWEQQDKYEYNTYGLNLVTRGHYL